MSLPRAWVGTNWYIFTTCTKFSNFCKKFVAGFKASEKKAGEKLSPDRKNIKRGYEAKNVRNIPEKLNRGRHHADEKKISEWKKKLKKNDITVEELATLIVAKASEKKEDTND